MGYPLDYSKTFLSVDYFLKVAVFPPKNTKSAPIQIFKFTFPSGGDVGPFHCLRRYKLVF